ncbi:PRC-barrel domain containing protein [Pseudonocardia acidicola]|uniref:PRC-barrel domain containing protein n=1 Tax=Pseudonocardia acidicola TaxID=2724939 RepID=A0ABX1S7Y1_9PSEU|nr:PRC-barrel domain containing protein [Pseudonocardia acidicola]NMH96992.1 PRC-barrel domain containing protein [Pseudonocardia acidicola]
MDPVTAHDLGRPIAYLALAEGTAVYDRDGQRIGVVDHVLADVPMDIFEGVIVHTEPLPGNHRYADADQIAGLYERGVLLAVRRDDLHEPREPSRPRVAVDGSIPAESPLEARLRRVWDWITAR